MIFFLKKKKNKMNLWNIFFQAKKIVFKKKKRKLFKGNILSLRIKFNIFKFL